MSGLWCQLRGSGWLKVELVLLNPNHSSDKDHHGNSKIPGSSRCGIPGALPRETWTN